MSADLSRLVCSGIPYKFIQRYLSLLMHIFAILGNESRSCSDTSTSPLASYGQGSSVFYFYYMFVSSGYCLIPCSDNVTVRNVEKSCCHMIWCLCTAFVMWILGDGSYIHDEPLSPTKALRAAMLKSRFAGTIVKAQQKALLDHVMFLERMLNCVHWNYAIHLQ